MDAIVRLNELLGRASKISDGQAKEATELLLSFYSETGDKTIVADYLMKFKSTVCLSFFEGIVKTPDTESQIQSIHSAICSTEAYKKNANHAATSRGFIISAVLIKNEINIARATLMRTITDVEKDGKFSDAVVSNFKQYVLDYCGSLEAIKALGEKAWSKQGDKGRFLRFMAAVDSSIVTIILPVKGRDDGRASHTPVVPESAALPVPKEKSAPVPMDSVAAELSAELIKTLSSASKEAATLLQSLSSTNGTISLLRKDIATRDLRIAELSAEINENKRAIADLHKKLNDSQQSVREGEAHVADLSERLKNSLHMDSISQNQELITLRTNLQSSLKIEYADYLVSKEGECNPDTYGALIGSLARIFKTLRRYGITIE